MELKPLSTWMDFISTSNYAAIIFSLQVLTLTLVVAYHLQMYYLGFMIFVAFH